MTSHVGEYLQDLGIRPCCVLCKGGEGVKMIQNGMMMSYKHAPPAPSSSNGDERGGCRFSTRKVCLLAARRVGGSERGRPRRRTRTDAAKFTLELLLLLLLSSNSPSFSGLRSSALRRGRAAVSNIAKVLFLFGLAYHRKA